jgi:hypothetical protein
MDGGFMATFEDLAPRHPKGTQREMSGTCFERETRGEFAPLQLVQRQGMRQLFFHKFSGSPGRP